MPELNKAYESLDPRFKPIVLQLLTALEAKGWQPIVVEGRRTLAQQKEKLRLGYTTTLNSYHLTGLAADICDKREMWDKGLVRQFWMDMADEVLKITPPKPSVLRLGLVWGDGGTIDTPLEKTRLNAYRSALAQLQAGTLTQRQADAKINWFCDAGHVELRV